ncbi:Enhancer of polycomb-like transcription factor protein [Zea mays]|nr:Enhancer of polycomb-like transcription factor protein [Zea mays]
MRHSRQRGKFQNLATFILSAGVAVAFASHGVHFVKLQSASALLHRPLAHCGWCALHGSTKSEPLLSVDFSALPSYFWSLHYAVALDSMYLPPMIRHSWLLVGGSEEIYPHTPLYVDSGAQSSGFATTNMDSNEPCRVVPNYMPLEQGAGLVVHGLRLKKHQRRRRTMRHPQNWRCLIARLPYNGIGMKQSTSAMQTGVKLRSSRQESPVEPVQPKAALGISLDLLENMDESDVSTPMGSTRRKRSLKSPVERMNEKLALAEVRQDIDSVHSKANLLVFQADRCWREEGAEVMLELSETNKWCIVVKIQGVTRYLLKPSDMRSYVINRHTQAYMWTVDDAWKLEFTDRWDWLLFKELHVVGCERNSQGKAIPIPGVHEVSGEMEGIVTDPFLRPVPDYIRMVDDEVGRALSRDSIYDMDSEDEQWLIQLNHSDSDPNSSQRNHISYEDFEVLISIFEKDAYNNPQGKNDLSELLSRYPALLKDDNVHAVYGYWTSKRSKRAAPLLRVFQGAPIRRGHLPQKSAMKRKRSFKRQKSRAGRGKHEALLQDNAEDEAALQRVAQADRAAKRALETAIQLRNRAQSLMTNAELAAYKSIMALRIAEAARISDSSRDIVCTILD